MIPELNNWKEGIVKKQYMSYDKAYLKKKANKIENIVNKFNRKHNDEFIVCFKINKHSDDDNVVTYTLDVLLTKVKDE